MIVLHASIAWLPPENHPRLEGCKYERMESNPGSGFYIFRSAALHGG
jgi:hypothetical protein